MMISKLAAVLAVFWLSLSIPSIAFAQTDGYLDSDGQINIKTDRLQMSETEKKKKKEEQSETVLDETGIPLFTAKMNKQLAAERKAERERLEKWQKTLFTGTSKTENTAAAYKTQVFNHKQTMPTEDEAHSDDLKNEKNKTVGGIVIGTLVAIIAGIYAACRNVFE